MLEPTPYTDAHNAALAYTAAGLSCIPIRSDGTKSPAIGEWKKYQTRLPTNDEIDQLFGGNVGVAVIGGEVSGGLECLDIDEPQLVDPFWTVVETEMPGLLAKVTVIATPRDNYGGRHIWYRIESPVSGNKKLALSEFRPQWNCDGTPQIDSRTGEQRLAPETMIETRGAGGYALVPGCPGECHDSGLTYKHIAGPPLTDVVVLTAEEHATLIQCARSFSLQVDAVLDVSTDGISDLDAKYDARSARSPHEPTVIAPGTDFNARTTWEEILEPSGWTKVATHGQLTHWRRPGKTNGTSATTGAGNDLLCVFSTNASPFQGASDNKPCTSYSKFAAYATLNFDGDFKAAARDLAEQGYGTRSARQATNGQAKNGQADWNCGADEIQSCISKQQAHEAKPHVKLPVTIRMSDVAPKPIQWLWRDHIALGKLTLIAGDPGLGKSFLSIDIITRVTRGGFWPIGCESAPEGSAIMLSCEDDPADTIRPRLDAAGADPSKVIVIEGIRSTDDEGGYDRPLDLERDIDVLEQVIDENPDCRVVTIDPISAYLGKADSNSNAEIRALLARLAMLAADKGVAVICITHLRKSEGPAVYRSMGSLAFVAAARAAWVVTRDQQDSTGRRRLFLPVKNNISGDTDGLAFCLETKVNTDGTPVVCWESEPIRIPIDEALGGGNKPRGPAPEERQEAEAFLLSVLANGPRLSKEVEEEAMETKYISKRTFVRAKKTLEIEAFREKIPGPWSLRLPNNANSNATAS